MSASQKSDKSAIWLNKVDFAYEKARALEQASLSVEKGEFVGFIGPNGGGKTTLFRLILGFLKPSSGEIAILGRPPKESSQKIGYVPQGLGFDRSFPITVLDVVLGSQISHSTWYRPFGKKEKEAAVEALKRLGLAHLAHAPFSSLSGGQAQRVLIARALASNPEVLLLDEPCANVDAKAEAQIYALLRKLKGSMTILMVTHDLDVATKLVDRVVCVNRRLDALARQQVCEHFGIGLYHPPLSPSGEAP